jgi:uncharacterized protein YndB with AHSA1/START domain
MAKITVETSVHAPVEKAWACWTNPDCITRWNAASDDWHSPRATNDLRVGGTFTARMEAKDGSAGFDFGGTYTAVEEFAEISYVMDDGRAVTVSFDGHGDHTHVTETFDAETQNPEDMQRQGWQAILDNFAAHVEAHRD